jgi:hypothetical protein
MMHRIKFEKNWSGGYQIEVLLALHHHAFRFPSTCAVVENIFKIWSILGSVCPAPGTQGDGDDDIHNFRSPLPIGAISQIWLKLVQCL